MKRRMTAIEFEDEVTFYGHPRSIDFTEMDHLSDEDVIVHHIVLDTSTESVDSWKAMPARVDESIFEVLNDY